jgi:hypothetical protein
LREGALVVFNVGGGRLGDGDADGHAEISLSEDWWGGTGPLVRGLAELIYTGLVELI